MTGSRPDDPAGDPTRDPVGDPVSQEQHEEISRLLADARHTDPIPPEVSARMDAVLAELAAPSSEPAPSQSAQPIAPVVSLSAHRRRRAGALLVAAATILVAGVALAQHRGTHPSTIDADATPDSRTSALSDQASDDAAPRSPDAAQAPESAEGNAVTPQLRHGRVVVHATTFAEDARGARQLLEANYSASRSDGPRTATCASVPAASDVVRARFEGARAVLAFLPPQGDSQVADLYLCGTKRPVRSVTLPAP